MWQEGGLTPEIFGPLIEALSHGLKALYRRRTDGIPPMGEGQCKSLGWPLLLVLGNPKSWQAYVPGSWNRVGFLSKPVIASCEIKSVPESFFMEFIGQKVQKLEHVKSNSSYKSIRGKNYFR